MRPSVAFLTCLLVAASGSAAAANTPLSFSPETWKVGMISQGERVELSLTVTNTSGTSLGVTIAPLCDCQSVDPPTRTIDPGGSAVFTLGYDSSDDVGNVRKDFLVTTGPRDFEKLYYTMLATVRAVSSEARKATPEPGTRGTGRESGELAGPEIYYYYSPGCQKCEEFLRKEIPRIEARTGVSIVVDEKDILQPGIYEELAAFASASGQSLREIPALRIGAMLLQGEEEISQRLEGLILASTTELLPKEPSPQGGISVARLAALPVILAGLLDGINPCAFTTLMFLLTSLALAGRGRREVLLIGILYSIAVFATYLAVGVGLFAALRAASSFALASRIIRWVLITALFALGCLSVYDYFVIRRGEPTKILLQLPTAVKRQIHRTIRTRARTAALAGGALATGFMVSLFEFACTGQVYVPTLAYLARVRGELSAAGLLVAYNVAFIAPLLAVFAVVYLGVSSERITELFRRRMGAVKLGLAAVFFGLGIFALVG